MLRFIRGSRLPKSWKFCQSEIPIVVDDNSTGKKLWNRHLRRIRTQIQVIKAFKDTMNIKEEIPSKTTKSLWLKSVKRVQTQLKVIKAFNSSFDIPASKYM